MHDVTDLHPSFNHQRYVFRRKVLKLFGGAFHVYDQRGNVVFYSKQKAFKLKEDLRIYSDESQSNELLKIKTAQILDISATYDVIDTTRGENVGALKRKGLKSILKDEWVLLSSDGYEIANLKEKSMARALLSRFLRFFPQDYIITTTDGHKVAEINQQFNPLVLKYNMNILSYNTIDRRLLIAAGILLAGIEGRQ